MKAQETNDRDLASHQLGLQVTECRPFFNSIDVLLKSARMISQSFLKASCVGTMDWGRRGFDATPNQRETVREETMPRTLLTRLLGMIGLAAIVAAPMAWAQDAPPVRVRGTIERVEDPVYVIKARDGAELKLTVAAKPSIAALVKASLADIKEGSFVGVTSMPQPDGSLSALEVHIFPEAMRGTGEGHYPWDLRPQSTMTNANVEQVGAAVDGRTLTLKYKDGEKKIFVPADTPIVIYELGDRTDLKPGAKVFIVAVKQSDGTFEGRAWRVGRDGAAPAF